MICPNCGTEIPAGNVYCPSCGEELRIGGEQDLLEEDYLQMMLINEAEEDLKQTRSKVRRKRLGRGILITIIVLLAILAGVLCYQYYLSHHTPEYLMGQAEHYFSARDYNQADSYADQVLEQEPENIEAMLIKGQIMAARKDYEAAEEYLLGITELDPGNIDAYKALAKLYDAQGAYKKIRKLSRTLDDPELVKIFSAYLISGPDFSLSEGKYDDTIEIQLRSAEHDYRIFYTLNGKAPTKKSTEYDRQTNTPIVIEEEGTWTVSAVCMDSEGHLSDVVRKTYELEYGIPAAPVIYPDGGRFYSYEKIEIRASQGCKIYYSWRTQNVTAENEEYTEPFYVIPGNNILSAVAVNKGGKISNVTKANFIFYPAPKKSSSSSSSSESSETAESTEDKEE